MDESTSSCCEALICAFVEGYGDMSIDLAFNVVVHAGVHMINWCSRYPGAALNGAVEVLMRKAIELVVRAWKEDGGWFEGDILGCLFKKRE